MERIEPSINNIPFSEYGVGLLSSWSVSGGAPDHTYHKDAHSIMFTVFSADATLREIKLPVTIMATDEQEIGRKKAAFEAQLMTPSGDTAVFGSVLLTLPDGFMYLAMLTGIGDDTTIAPGYHMVTYKLTGSKHMSPQYENIPASALPFTVNNEGSRNAPVYISFTAGTSSPVVCGIAFKGLASGANVKIDGITKRVLVNGAPDFTKCNLIQWPSLRPGENAITATGVTGSIYAYWLPSY